MIHGRFETELISYRQGILIVCRGREWRVVAEIMGGGISCLPLLGIFDRCGRSWVYYVFQVSLCSIVLGVGAGEAPRKHGEMFAI